jgi:hypothetical protein
VNTDTRSEPSRSRARRSDWRLTCTGCGRRLDLGLDQQLAALALGSARGDGAPRRTRASVGAPGTTTGTPARPAPRAGWSFPRWPPPGRVRPGASRAAPRA